MSELVVEHVTKRYTTPAEDLVVLEDASLQLKQGENAAIIGPSGSGKSTLLHILGALDSPTSGTVKLGGVSPFGLSPNDLADFRNQKIGFIFQDHHLLPQLTVLENVLIPYRMEENFDLLKRAGFKDMEVFFRWYNFCGIIAIK